MRTTPLLPLPPPQPFNVRLARSSNPLWRHNARSDTHAGVYGLEAGLEAFTTALVSTPSAASLSEVAALGCVGDVLLVLTPNAMASATNESSLETDGTTRDVANSKRFGFLALLEQELWSRVTNAHRTTSLRHHERLLRQLPAVTNESTAWTIAALRASVGHDLSRLVSLVNNSGPSFDANATARRLANLGDELPEIAGFSDVGHVISSFDELTDGDGFRLAPEKNDSFDVDGRNSHDERMADYIAGVMSFQLQRTRSTLDEEFQIAQDKIQSISTTVDTEMQDEITAIVAELRELTKQYDRGGVGGGGAGKLGAGVAFLSESRASHMLHRLPKSPTTVLTRSPPPTTRSSPSSLLSPWWWWKWWWSSHPTWNNATGEQDVTAGDNNSTSNEGGTGIMPFLMNGAASDSQRTLVWYAIKGESIRLAFVVLELAAGIFTDSLMATPQLDARRIAAMRSIVRALLALPSLHPTAHLTASCGAISSGNSLGRHLLSLLRCKSRARSGDSRPGVCPRSLSHLHRWHCFVDGNADSDGDEE
jgi:hypothetical protein